MSLERARLLLLALGGLLFGGGLGAVAGDWLGTEYVPPPVAITAEATPRPPSAQAMTLLVMASDAKGSTGRKSLNSNTDTLLLVRLDPAAHRVGALAIPRDTRVPIKGHGTFKINAANSWGGPDLAVRTVQDFLGVKVDRHLLLNLKGVRALVDTLGGLDVTIPKRVHYVDHAGDLHIDFQQGRQHLSGQQVEEYLRFRHDDKGDIGRVQRLQAFLIEFAHQFLNPVHLFQVPTLWATLQQYSDTDLSLGDILSLAPMLRQIDPARDLELTFLPGRDERVSGPWYWVADIEGVRPFMARYFPGVEAATPSARAPRVMVENRTGQDDATIAPAVHQLEAAGYRILRVVRHAAQGETRVIAERGDREGAGRLASLVGRGEIVVAGIGEEQSDFTLQLGQDWLPPPTQVSRR